MKKIVLISILALALLLAACGAQPQTAQPSEDQSQTAEPTAEPAAEAAEEVVVAEPAEETAPNQDGQNPVMNFVGVYAAGRRSIEVACEGMDGARFSVTWSSSAWEHSEWTMSGKFDEETLTVNYSDCVRKDVAFNEDGSVSTETVVYENGKGSVTFLYEQNALTWNDEQEHMADDLVFQFAATDDPAYYTAFTAMDKGAVEAFAMDIRNAYLAEDWQAIADAARFPILVNGTSYDDREAFLNYMAGCTVSESARADLQAESCHDMFINGQGLCLGSGQVWLLDPSYMTENEPVIQVISLNDIVAK